MWLVSLQQIINKCLNFYFLIGDGESVTHAYLVQFIISLFIYLFCKLKQFSNLNIVFIYHFISLVYIMLQYLKPWTLTYSTMSFSKFASSLSLLTVVLLFKATFGVDPLFHICSSPDNFTTNDPYETNLKELVSYLSYETPTKGFGLGSNFQVSRPIPSIWTCSLSWWCIRCRLLNLCC